MRHFRHSRPVTESRIRQGAAVLLAVAIISTAGVASVAGQARQPEQNAPAEGPNLDLTDATVQIDADLEILIFTQEVSGTAGGTVPRANGQVDGAPVLGYVFPTTLSPTDVGFADGDGIVALAATSHPDFDDTPLWDENGDRDYTNDGRVFHTHWVVLVPDDRVPGGLSVKETMSTERDLPPTAPGMPLYLDSPGFKAQLRGSTLRIIVPLDRVAGHKDFRFDAVTAYMEVNQSVESRPMLGVYKVYDVLSGDLSLPYSTIPR